MMTAQFPRIDISILIMQKMIFRAEIKSRGGGHGPPATPGKSYSLKLNWRMSVTAEALLQSG